MQIDSYYGDYDELGISLRTRGARKRKRRQEARKQRRAAEQAAAAAAVVPPTQTQTTANWNYADTGQPQPATVYPGGYTPYQYSPPSTSANLPPGSYTAPGAPELYQTSGDSPLPLPGDVPAYISTGFDPTTNQPVRTGPGGPIYDINQPGAPADLVALRAQISDLTAQRDRAAMAGDMTTANALNAQIQQLQSGQGRALPPWLIPAALAAIVFMQGG